MRCPQCKTQLSDRPAQCPRCKADLSLLADVTQQVESLRGQARAAKSAGQIGPAVEAYLKMLELDTTDAEARDALGESLRAIRTALRLEPTPRPLWPYWLLAAFAGTIGLMLGYYMKTRS